MKLTAKFKNPDAFEYAIEKALDNMEFDEENDRETVKERLSKQVNKWIEYGEYVTIELDLETGEKRCL